MLIENNDCLSFFLISYQNLPDYRYFKVWMSIELIGKKIQLRLTKEVGSGWPK